MSNKSVHPSPQQHRVEATPDPALVNQEEGSVNDDAAGGSNKPASRVDAEELNDDDAAKLFGEYIILYWLEVLLSLMVFVKIRQHHRNVVGSSSGSPRHKVGHIVNVVLTQYPDASY